jgi:hypothetical protein
MVQRDTTKGDGTCGRRALVQLTCNKVRYGVMCGSATSVEGRPTFTGRQATGANG